MLGDDVRLPTVDLQARTVYRYKQFENGQCERLAGCLWGDMTAQGVCVIAGLCGSITAQCLWPLERPSAIKGRRPRGGLRA